MTKDRLYQNIHGQIKPFEFDERVADVFPDMIQRSVPGYGQTLSMLSVIAKEYAQANSNIYDLGCSLGAASLAIRQSIEEQDCRIIAVDNSEAMVARCKKNIQRDHSNCPVDVIQSDILGVKINNASIVVMNFTLQFIPLLQRPALLKNIYKGLRPGGVLVLSEKILMESEAENNLMIELHHQYKRLNGYDDMEIAGKRSALENVLVPETLSKHKARLESSGFSEIQLYMQCLNFVSLIAEKQA